MPENRILCFISIYFVLGIFSLHAVSAAKSSKSCPIFPPKHSCPKDAKSPINIVTKNAIFANVSTPIHVVNGILGALFVINTGKALEIYAIPGLYSTHITLFDGGVLCGEQYKFYKLRIWISQDPNGRSYNEINGKGSPLTITLYYYNRDYETFQEAIKHPGGVVAISFMITHGPIPNPLFPIPNVAIRLFHFAGTGLAIPLAGLLYSWFNVVPFINKYFAFCGTYEDFVTGKVYSNLSAFQSLLNKNGNSLETIAPLHDTTQDIYWGLGITEGFVLI